MYKDQAIMAVKAPPEATLHVPQPINNLGQQKVTIDWRATASFASKAGLLLLRCPVHDNLCLCAIAASNAHEVVSWGNRGVPLSWWSCSQNVSQSGVHDDATCAFVKRIRHALPAPELLANGGSGVRVEPVPSVESSLNTRLCTPVISAVTSLAGMRDALLCESDDYGPMGGGKFQLQTEDQISTPGRIAYIF